MFSSGQALKLLEHIFGAKVAVGSTLTDEEAAIIFKVVQTLSPREERIVRQRLRGMTFREIGEDMNNWSRRGGVSANAICQAYNGRIRRKLCHPSRSRALKPILNRLEIIG